MKQKANSISNSIQAFRQSNEYESILEVIVNGTFCSKHKPKHKPKHKLRDKYIGARIYTLLKLFRTGNGEYR